MLEEGDVVLCTVDKIVGTTVFVKIENNGEGTIITSEIAPGRIRNLRTYVSPGRKIVCKILSIKGDQINLSLRRVTTKEKKEVMEKAKEGKKLEATIKTLFPDKQDTIKKIKEKGSLVDFFTKAKEEPEILKKYLDKEEIDKILKILKEKKEKEKEIKINFSLASYSENGINKIKSILNIKKENIKITYVAAGKYSLRVKAKDYKEANKEAEEVLEKVEEEAKKEKMFFERQKEKKK